MLQPPQPHQHDQLADATFTVPPLDPIAPLRDALRRRYEFEREIGQGAFATVYLARDLKHERQVAIKVLNADPTSETSELRSIVPANHTRFIVLIAGGETLRPSVLPGDHKVGIRLMSQDVDFISLK